MHYSLFPSARLLPQGGYYLISIAAHLGWVIVLKIRVGSGSLTATLGGLDSWPLPCSCLTGLVDSFVHRDHHRSLKRSVFLSFGPVDLQRVSPKAGMDGKTPLFFF